MVSLEIFQSTLPARGATIPFGFNPRLDCISIHAPRTGSDKRFGNIRTFVEISIHAPRTGSDNLFFEAIRIIKISIHAPRTGSDLGGIVSKEWSKDISIHAPRTGSDDGANACIPRLAISIHAPRTGSDDYTKPKIVRGNNFNPRSPHGERLDCQSNRVYRSQFQSTLPARGAT